MTIGSQIHFRSPYPRSSPLPSRGSIAKLDFTGPAPDPAELARRWHRALDPAPAIVETLPPDEVGTCVLLNGGVLCRLPADELTAALEEGTIRFRTGSIGGALPTLRP